MNGSCGGGFNPVGVPVVRWSLHRGAYLEVVIPGNLKGTLPVDGAAGHDGSFGFGQCPAAMIHYVMVLTDFYRY